MIIHLKNKKIKVDGNEHLLKIRLIIGWHVPNISFQLPNMTINNTFFNAIFILMDEYVKLRNKYDRMY